MKIEELSRLALFGVRLNDYNPAVVSDCIYRSIRLLQRETRCSKGAFQFTVPQSMNDKGIVVTSGSTVTKIWMPENHGFRVGDKITISDLGVLAYNGSVANNTTEDDWFITAVGYNYIQFNVNTNYDADYDISDGDGLSVALTNAQYSRAIQPFYSMFAKNGNVYESFIVSPMVIDELYDIYTDGSLNRYNLLDRPTVENINTDFRYSESSILDGAVDYENDSVNLITNFDQRGKSFLVVMRYTIPYIQDYNVRKETGYNLPDLMLSTIPDVLKDTLIIAVKTELYKHMDEFTGMVGKYSRHVQSFQFELAQEMIRAKKMINNHISKETVTVVRPNSILGGC